MSTVGLVCGIAVIRYNHDTLLTITIILRYSDSAKIYIFQKNLNKLPVKRLSASFLSFTQVQSVRKQQKSSVNQF